ETLISSSSSNCSSRGSSPTSPPAPPSRSSILGTQADPANNKRPTIQNSGSEYEKNSRRTVLLAAVFPCPTLTELDISTAITTNTNTNSTTTTATADSTVPTGTSDGDHCEDIGDNGATTSNNPAVVPRAISGDEDQQPSNDNNNNGTTTHIEPPSPPPTIHQRQEGRPRRAAALASALADALDGCGLWLPPKDFEARVLTPTRALIDLQLNILDRNSETVKLATEKIAAAKKNATTNTAESNISQEMEAFFAPIT
ncbi:unnamed protein product, partial [Laminaria digitata]